MPQVSSIAKAIALLSVLVYVSGLLVCLTAEGQYAAWGNQLWLRARYVHVGVFYAALPLLIVSLLLIAQYLEPRREEAPFLGPRQKRFYRMLILIVFSLFVADFYLMVLLGERKLFRSDFFRFTLVVLNIGILVVVLLRGVLFYLRPRQGTTNMPDDEDATLKPDIDPLSMAAKRVLMLIRVTQIIIGVMLLVLLVFIMISLAPKLAELVHYRLPALTTYLMTTILIVYVVAISINRFASSRPWQAVLTSMVASGVALVLLGYLSITAFAFGIYRYIPSSRFGGDYTSMPTITFYDDSMQPVIPVSDNDIITGQRTKLLLLDVTDDAFLVVPFSDTHNLTMWRRGRDDKDDVIRPTVYAVRCDSIKTYSLNRDGARSGQ